MRLIRKYPVVLGVFSNSFTQLRLMSVLVRIRVSFSSQKITDVFGVQLTKAESVIAKQVVHVRDSPSGNLT